MRRDARRFAIVTAADHRRQRVGLFRELEGGDAFVARWAVIPAAIASGHAWITILTAMFMHGSWLHILGNMVFCAIALIKDAMGRLRYLAF